jgi:hypothetical protein
VKPLALGHLGPVELGRRAVQVAGQADLVAEQQRPAEGGELVPGDLDRPYMALSIAPVTDIVKSSQARRP